MALSWRSPSPLSPLHFQSHKLSSIPNPLVSETVFRFQTRFSLAKSLFPFPTSIPFTSNPRFPSLPTICSSVNSDSASASDDFPTLFIKGLPKSTSEGRLRKAFLEFGEVNRVKILTDPASGQSLGLAYVWFVKEQFAQLAVRQMNGKVYICDNCKETIQKTKKSEAVQVLIHCKSCNT